MKESVEERIAESVLRLSNLIESMEDNRITKIIYVEESIRNCSVGGPQKK